MDDIDPILLCIVLFFLLGVARPCEEDRLRRRGLSLFFCSSGNDTTTVGSRSSVEGLNNRIRVD